MADVKHFDFNNDDYDLLIACNAVCIAASATVLHLYVACPIAKVHSGIHQ